MIFEIFRSLVGHDSGLIRRTLNSVSPHLQRATNCTEPPKPRVDLGISSFCFLVRFWTYRTLKPIVEEQGEGGEAKMVPRSRESRGTFIRCSWADMVQVYNMFSGGVKIPWRYFRGAISGGIPQDLQYLVLLAVTSWLIHAVPSMVGLQSPWTKRSVVHVHTCTPEVCKIVDQNLQKQPTNIMLHTFGVQVYVSLGALNEAKQALMLHTYQVQDSD